MEARPIRAVLLAVVLLASLGASYRSPNFVVQAQDPRLATKIAQAAEKYRRDLAVSWLGKAMPNWAAPCEMTVRVGPHLGAGGATTFVFDKGEVHGWQMTIQGSAERIFDSVLPHEITHMVFASHFRQPLPRWADEGAASSVEHSSERNRYHRMLQRFLCSGRGIAFNKMYALTEYPGDVMPLYCQGLTLAEYLIAHGGRRKFIEYVAEGLKTHDWPGATRRHYAIRDLGALQTQWLAWVGRGYPPLQPRSDQPQVRPQPGLLASADVGRRPRPEPNLIYRIAKERTEERSSLASHTNDVPPLRPVRPASQLATATQASAVDPFRSHLTRPQPIQPSRQIILDWRRR